MTEKINEIIQTLFSLSYPYLTVPGMNSAFGSTPSLGPIVKIARKETMAKYMLDSASSCPGHTLVEYYYTSVLLVENSPSSKAENEAPGI